MLATTLPTPLYDLYRHRFGLTALMVTVIFAVYALGVIASLLLFGRPIVDLALPERRDLTPLLAPFAQMGGLGLGPLLAGLFANWSGAPLRVTFERLSFRAGLSGVTAATPAPARRRHLRLVRGRLRRTRAARDRRRCAD